MLKNSSKSVILPQNLRVGNYLCIDNLPSKIEGFSPNDNSVDFVVVWLKIRRHDIPPLWNDLAIYVVVWLKIRRHDISQIPKGVSIFVVVWLKIRRHDI